MTVLLNYYNTGTASVTNGTTGVTGVGTFWGSAIRAGDIFTANGLGVRVASVTDDTHLVLAYNWPGTTLTTASYEIRLPPPSADVTTSIRTLLETLAGPTFTSTTTFPDSSTWGASGIAGLTALTMTGSGQIAGSSSAGAGAPAFTFAGDLDTGIFHPTANTFAWSAGGSEIVRGTSAGLVVGPNAVALTSDWVTGNGIQSLNATYGTLSAASSRADAAGIRIGSLAFEYITNLSTYRTIAVIEGVTQPSGTANKRGGVLSFRLQPDNTAGNSEYMQLSTSGLGVLPGSNVPSQYRFGAQDLVVGNTTGDHGISIIANTANKSMLAFGYGTSNVDGASSNRAKIWYDGATDLLNFSAAGGLVSAPWMTLGGGGFIVGGSSNVPICTMSIGTTINSSVLYNGRWDHNGNTYLFQGVNNDLGAAATCLGQLTNGVNGLQLVMAGRAYTTSGIYRQGGGIISCDGPGGLTLNTGISQPIYFGINNVEQMRLTVDGAVLMGTSGTTGNHGLSNHAFPSSKLGYSSGGAAITLINTVTGIAANTTYDALRFLDMAGTVIGLNSVAGIVNLYIKGTTGANAITVTYAINTTGLGTTNATFTQLNTGLRGTNPVSAVGLANDGSSGGVKITLTTINNALVAGGTITMSFFGQVF